jgi:hypothetical protein
MADPNNNHGNAGLQQENPNQAENVFDKIKKTLKKEVMCRGKKWFLRACEVRGVVPRTLQHHGRDPQAHQPGYTEAKAAA